MSLCHGCLSHLSCAISCACVPCHTCARVPNPPGIATSVSGGHTRVPMSVCPTRAPTLCPPHPLLSRAVTGDRDKVVARVPWPWRGGCRVLRARGSVTREGGATSPPRAIKPRAGAGAAVSLALSPHCQALPVTSAIVSAGTGLRSGGVPGVPEGGRNPRGDNRLWGPWRGGVPWGARGSLGSFGAGQLPWEHRRRVSGREMSPWDMGGVPG